MWRKNKNSDQVQTQIYLRKTKKEMKSNEQYKRDKKKHHSLTFYILNL